MSDHWDFYFARVNDVESSLFVDLGIRKDVPAADRPWLLWLWVYMNAPQENGMSSSEEAPRLHALEDAFTAPLAAACGAELVGRITGDSRREFYYYGTGTEAFEQAARAVLANFPEYRFDLGTHHDPEWSQYLNVLYPGPRDLTGITNRRVIDALAEQGDDASLPRPIEHWAYFRSPEARAAFASQATAQGFAITGEHQSDEGENEQEEAEEFPYGLVFKREDVAEWHAINDVTLALEELAEEHGGYYDGWESPVTKKLH